MVVLAVAVFVMLSSCAVGYSGSTNSVSMSLFTDVTRLGGRWNMKFIHYATKLSPDVAQHRQNCVTANS